MGNVVKQELKYCKECERTTLHMRNGKEINWIKHLFLTLITFGFWLIWLLLKLIGKGFTSPILGTGKANHWVCSVCGVMEGQSKVSKAQYITEKNKEKRNQRLRYMVFVGLGILIYFLLNLSSSSIEDLNSNAKVKNEIPLTKAEQEVERQKVIAKYSKLNTVNCSKLKTDIRHQEKNVENTKGRYYSSMLYSEKKCNSTSECIKLRKKQEEFFVLKLEKLKTEYDASCEK